VRSRRTYARRSSTTAAEPSRDPARAEPPTTAKAQIKRCDTIFGTHTIDDNFKTRLIEKAIEMAARNHKLGEGAIFHSDRGSNYTSRKFARTLQRHGLQQSVERTGICYDNALSESFFAALKNERVHRTQYPTREHARRGIVRYIEFWYNSRRRHSSLGYRSPQQVHDEYLERQQAA
jgi:putative transposase